MQVQLGNEQMIVVNETKCFWVTVDKQLKWNFQVNNAAASLGRKVSQLRRLPAMPPSVLQKIYFQGILPGSLFGIAVWGDGSITRAIRKSSSKSSKVNLQVTKRRSKRRSHRECKVETNLVPLNVGLQY